MSEIHLTSCHIQGAEGEEHKGKTEKEVAEITVLLAIDQSRQSVSGVDEDEEAEDLMVFQQMLMNQYKVLSVMNEVLDKSLMKELMENGQKQ